MIGLFEKAKERASSSKNELQEETKDDFFASLFEYKQGQKGGATKIPE